MNSASDFAKDMGLVHEAVVTGRSIGFGREEWAKLAHDKDKFLEVLMLVRGEATLDFNPIIPIDRSQKPTYPDWVKDVLHPELEGQGPAVYAITQVGLWLHDDQKDGKWMKGQAIYDHLVQNQMLESCLSLRDLEEIQKRGSPFFRKHFRGKAVFGWKSVVRNRIGNLRVPYLTEGDGEVVLGWHWLGRGWYDCNPALRFASPQVYGAMNS